MRGNDKYRNGLLLTACAACLMVLIGAGACTAARSSTGSLAGVLDSKGRVFVIDLETGRIRKTVKLRSWAFDIGADSSNRTFVTAQSGGADVDADDKVGIVPASTLGRVRYVKLPRPNPYGIEVIGDGKVIADHGWMDDRGMWVSVVDTNLGKVTKTGHVPDLNISLRSVNGLLWGCCAQENGRRSLRRIDPDTLASAESAVGSQFPIVETSGSGGIYGWLMPEPGQGIVTRFNAKTGAVEMTRSVELEDGPGRLVFCRQKLIAADYTGNDPGHAGTRLLVIDPETLEVEREIRVAGSPCGMEVWRDRVVVCSLRDQQLLIIDPATGTTEQTIQLPRMTQLDYYLAIMD